ncbi:exodeoxyribonuclease V subunit alpha [Alishewanella sp. d11]|uniref:exodeoxyribonuclease V subunit alpha n=1 Tax=Alishewanella sp. d11 TaxID=3414030 RepID=UPI003BF924BE
MSDANSLFAPTHCVASWHQSGWLRAIDVNLANLLLRAGTSAPIAALGALLSYQAGRGHTCLSLTELITNPLDTLGIEEDRPEFIAQLKQLLPDSSQIEIALQRSEAVYNLDVADAEDTLQPLVWDRHHQLLFLRRYWQHENRIAAWLQGRTEKAQQEVPPEQLQAVIAKLNNSKGDSISWQRVACANAVRKMFSVITGGPGTGKTYTVVRVLATLLAFHHAASDIRIALAAPTGKAAARMDESINKALNDTNNPELLNLKQVLTRKASTLHRLLGVQRHTRYFRHNRNMPLPYDVVVVDEASMIDTEMFDALLDAIGPATRLILLGDKDQLAPVEAGSILASICRNAEQRQYSDAHRQWLAQASGENLTLDGGEQQNHLSDHIVMLEGSERFSGAIAVLANAVNACDIAAANHALTRINVLRPDAKETKASIPTIASAASSKVLWQTLADGFTDFINRCNQHEFVDDDAIDSWAAEVLKAFSTYQLLTALREGPWGQIHLNQIMTQLLHTGHGSWYHGRPVIVTTNDYSLNLNNGDIGIALMHPKEQRLRVVFAAPVSQSNPKGVRWILPSRLSAVETVYAMTVHKSQGSEFDHTVLILPDRPTPVLTKELIYTGITRAKSDLTLVIPDQQVWEQGVKSRIQRLGGLG